MTDDGVLTATTDSTTGTTTGATTTRSTAEPAALVERAVRLVEEAERPDLRARLHHTRRRLADPSVRVLVVGEFKQGKSALVNALVGAPVCPVDDDVATAIPTEVAHGEVPSAELVRVAGPAGEGPEGEEAADDLPLERAPVALDRLADHVTVSAEPHGGRRVVRAEVRLPRAVLSGGLVLVDTPGVGGLGSAHALATLAALATADAVLLVSDASQEFSEPEMEFLRQALRLCPTVTCVLTKTDLHPQWRRVADLDRAHLASAGVGVRLLPVSSALRSLAVRSGDAELHEESGFPALVAHLRRDVVDQAALLLRRSTRHDLLAVTEHLSLSLRAELRALEDPAGSPAVVSGLQAARERADGLRRRSARWQQTLGDGIADLVSDIDHDLRDRMRVIGREAEEAIDEGDPGQVWDEFAAWLQQRVAAAASDNVLWAGERAQWLAEQVAQHFTDDGGTAVPALGGMGADGALAAVAPLDRVDDGHVSPAQKLLIGMRGSYGGVLMFGLLTGIAGMALINPISVGAGLLLGGKAYAEDKQARLKRRQAEAKTAVRRQLDDVVFQLSKDAKDRLRLVQRTTRDHFADLAEELHRSLQDSVAAAQKAAKVEASQRERRLAEVRATLAQVEELSRAAAALAGPVLAAARA